MDKSIPEIATLYLGTEVYVCDSDIWITAFDYCSKYSTQLCVITAWNPGDERWSIETNESQNELLFQDLQTLGFSPIEAVGKDPASEHSEKSWAVAGISTNDAVSLGAKYRQVGIFHISEFRQTVHGCFEAWSVWRDNPNR
jgi:hypothetical protein